MSIPAKPLITRQSTVEIKSNKTEAIRLATSDLLSDLKAALDREECSPGPRPRKGVPLWVCNKGAPADSTESYTIQWKGEAGAIVIEGNNELGTLFGIYALSRDVLGVDPFHRWSLQQPRRRSTIPIPETPIFSPSPRFRFRGWFINGEDSLIAASGANKVSPEYYEWIFETLLRTGNNMVIPGTFPEHPAPQFEVAIRRGLWLTHHHSEPLGAPLFSYTYPGQDPDFRKSRAQYRELYLDAAKWYAERGAKTVFTVGFRGQGDCPFWKTGEEPSDDVKRSVIVEAIRLQMEVLEDVFGRNGFRAVFPFYAEMHALFCDHLNLLPDSVILCWADNGYGAMRVRRAAGVTDENQPSIPDKPQKRPQGVYYHINFHDAQASNQLTMLVDPRLILGEYQRMEGQYVRDFSICNAGNIRPHMYTLGLLSDHLNGRIPDAPAETAVIDFGHSYFSLFMDDSSARKAARLQLAYFDCPITFGKFPDQRAGDEFYHYVSRAIVARTLELPGWDKSLKFLFDEHGGLDGLLDTLSNWCKPAQQRWNALLREILELRKSLKEGCGIIDSGLLFQTWFCATSNALLQAATDACSHACQDRLQHAFVHACYASGRCRELLDLLERMDNAFLKNFYTGEFLTNVKATQRALRLFTENLRLRIDGSSLYSASSMVNAKSRTPNGSVLPHRYYRDNNNEVAAVLADLFQVHVDIDIPPPLPSDFLHRNSH